jgi:hypothetical protein
MTRRRRQFIAARFEDSDCGSDGSDDCGSVRAGTVLDWSMDYAHGGQSHTEAATELNQIQQKADTLEKPTASSDSRNDALFSTRC